MPILRTALLAGVSLVAIASAQPAWAQSADVKARLDALEAQLKAQQQVIAKQQAEIDALRAVAAAPTPAAPPAEVAAIKDEIITLKAADEAHRLADADRAKLTVVAGRPTFSSADGRYTLAVRGIAQLDLGLHDQDPAGPLTSDFRRGSLGAGGRETEAARDLSDGANFRRARFGVEGTFDRDFAYRFMFEFGGSGTEGPARINDAWISYTGFAPFTIQTGAFAPPANMDDGQGPEDQIFIERASASELSRALAGADGRVGLGARGAGTRWFAAATVTGPTVNDAETFDEQLGFVGRAAFLALTSPDYNLQVGLSGSYVVRSADQGASVSPRYPIRFRDRPEIRLDSTRLVDTGSIDADNAWVTALEAGFQWKSLYLQGERFWFGIERRASALSDPGFDGGYLEGTWILTGETRRHNMASGAFQNPRPHKAFSPRNGGWGAFEVALRYSWLDLDHNEGAAGTAAAADAVRGGEQRIWAAGLNWYPNSNTKVLINWLHIDVDRLNPAGPGNTAPFGTAPATPPVGVQIGQDLDVYAVRTQFAF